MPDAGAEAPSANYNVATFASPTFVKATQSGADLFA
jgi:hypothetical protein